MTGTPGTKPKIRIANILIAVFAIVAGAALVFAGWNLRAQHALGEAVVEARASAGAAMAAWIAAETQRFDARRRVPEVVVAVQAGDTDAARLALADAGQGIAAIEIHPADLSAAWAAPDRFGYGKLGLLAAALESDAVQVAVVQDAGRPWLALAASIRGEDGVLALAYVRHPLDDFAAPLRADPPQGGFLALRQGQHTLVQVGDAQLAGGAELGAVPLPPSRLRVVGAAPFAEGGTLGLYGLVELLAGLLVILGGLALVLVPREKAAEWARRLAERRAGPALPSEPTLAEQIRAIAGAPVERSMPKPVVSGSAMPDFAIDRSIFRAYDIRGVVGQTLNADIARLIGRAVGARMREKGLRGIAVGRDGRLSSPEMARALIDGLRISGIDVTDVGMVPTPVAYFAAYELRLGSAIAVTGSHNPPDYNGFKIVVDGETLSGNAIAELYARIVEGRMPLAERRGDVEVLDIGQAYIDRIAGDIQIERRLRVVVDAGSGVAGELGPRLLEAIGADVETLYCEIDGTFPFHHPDPSDPHNLKDLVQAVQRAGADIGLAFDGDGDRLGVVTRQGEMIYPDRLLMLFAADVLERNPGACILYDVKCSGHLAGFVLRHGGSPLMWKTGHSLIKAKMKETGAELAGEMSGHFFFKERWLGFDDGLYAAARLLEILATRAEEPEEVFAELPASLSTPELKVPMAEGEPHAFIEAFTAAARFEGARLSTIDGVRADWADRWGLVRASNTTPILVLRFEADDEAALARVQADFRTALLAVRGDLALPF